MEFIYKEGGYSMFNHLNEVNKIEYVCCVSENDVVSKYKKLCKWLCEEFTKDINNVHKENLNFFEETIQELEKDIKLLLSQSNDVEKYVSLRMIENKNKKEFNELVEDIQDEHYFLDNKKEDGYNHYTKIFSWYKLAPDFINSSVNNMSMNVIDLDGIVLKNLATECDDMKINMEYDKSNILYNRGGK